MSLEKKLKPGWPIAFGALLVLVGHAHAQTIKRSQLGSSFDIRYGTVESIERVKVQSQAAQGAVMGVSSAAQPLVIGIGASMQSKAR